MKKITARLKKIYPALISGVLLLPLAANATILDLMKGNLDKAGGATELPGGNPDSLPLLIGKIIKAGLTLLGMVFLVLIVYAGFVWLLAGGREEEVQRAQKIIETSIIGLIVVVSAYAISTFVFRVIEQAAS